MLYLIVLLAREVILLIELFRRLPAIDVTYMNAVIQNSHDVYRCRGPFSPLLKIYI